MAQTVDRRSRPLDRAPANSLSSYHSDGWQAVVPFPGCRSLMGHAELLGALDSMTTEPGGFEPYSWARRALTWANLAPISSESGIRAAACSSSSFALFKSLLFTRTS